MKSGRWEIMGNGKDKERESYLFYSKKRKGKIATSSHPLPFNRATTRQEILILAVP
jgi:hypothetical protein